jgi:hypothetical protein
MHLATSTRIDAWRTYKLKEERAPEADNYRLAVT